MKKQIKNKIKAVVLSIPLFFFIQPIYSRTDSLHFNSTKEEKKIAYYQNGVKAYEIAYRNGIPNGIWMEWHPNGQLKHIETLINGATEGNVINLYSSGLLQSNEQFEKGLLNGKAVYYYPNGHKKSEGTYVNNEEEGTWYYYNNEASKIMEINFRNGILNGKMLYYNSYGKLLYEAQYEQGTIMTEKGKRLPINLDDFINNQHPLAF